MIRAALIAVMALAASGDDPLAGRVAGTPRRCIDPRGAGPEIRADGRMIYRPTGRTWFVTRPIGPCPSLRRTSTLIVEIYGTDLCRNDRFRTREATDIIPSGYCRIDAFVPYTKAR